MKQFYIAVDFDGTIAQKAWPHVGEMIKDADIVLRKLYEDGHIILINTCRTGKYEGLAEYFLIENNIPYHYVNSNHPDLIVKYGQDSRKISADIYIDDKGIGGLPEWKEIYEIITKKAQG